MQSIKDEFIFWAKRLYSKGMSPATSGNISVKCDEGILITAAGSCAGDLTYKDIILTDDNGNSLSEGKPSSEKFMHIEIYEAREDIKAVIHSHCPYITAFAVNGVPIKEPILPEFIYQFGEIPIVEYATPSTIKLAEVCAKPFGEGKNAVLMKNHGIVVGAGDLKSCVYILESIRAYVETYFGALVLGGVSKLNKKQIEDIKKLKG